MVRDGFFGQPIQNPHPIPILLIVQFSQSWTNFINLCKTVSIFIKLKLYQTLSNFENFVKPTHACSNVLKLCRTLSNSVELCQTLKCPTRDSPKWFKCGLWWRTYSRIKQIFVRKKEKSSWFFFLSKLKQSRSRTVDCGFPK